MSTHIFLKKTLRLIISMLLFTFILYGLLYLSTGDPALSVLRKLGVQTLSPEVIIETRTKLGIEGNFFDQYVHWLLNTLRGDLGHSFMNNLPVKTLLLEKFFVTFRLMSSSFILCIVLSLLIGGVIGNSSSYQWTKQIFSILLSFPIYWLAILAIFIFGVQLNWLPFVGSRSIRHFILPVLVISFAEGSYLTKMVSDLVATVAKSERQVLAKFRGIKCYYRYYYQLNELFVALISLYGTSLVHLFGSCVMIEIIFSISGFGKLLMDAISTRDYPVIQGITLVVACGTFILNYLIDLAIQKVDSRVVINQGGKE
ncbi:sodium:proton antiporter [Enterococcus ureilyticus]|uniref:Sodium:proton antiporter n=1 Tax=Enterococcus ureilyticus TaxID=1131292 RepID=A0A1E5HG94_9ENTE|nr:ABC transporter permease [Enterococcus ureilyticus]OEG23941.1 sodium:proton antiporter [Enterococcus ureilyticus]